MSGARFAFGISSVLLLLSMLSTMMAWYYIAYTKKAEMLNHLSNCKQLNGMTASSVSGWWGHFWMMGNIANILLLPKISIDKWGADPYDIECFPTKLRRLIVSLRILILFQLFCMFALSAVVEFTDWVR